MQNKNRALIYALITVAIWGTAATASKLMLKNISNFQLMFYVALFATISTFGILFFTRKIKSSYILFKENWSIILLLGIIGSGIQQFFYFTALANGPTAQINVLNYMWPIFMLLLSVFILKEKLSFKIIISFLLGIIGVYIVITRGQFFSFQIQYLYAYLLALGGAFCWALFSILNKTKNYEPISSVFLFNLVGLIFMTLVMLFTNSSFNVPFNQLIGSFYIGLFPTTIALILWVKALQIGKASFIANLGHLTPFISLVFIFIILREKILLSEIIGLIVIVSGILLYSLKSTVSPKLPESKSSS